MNGNWCTVDIGAAKTVANMLHKCVGSASSTGIWKAASAPLKNFAPPPGGEKDVEGLLKSELAVNGFFIMDWYTESKRRLPVPLIIDAKKELMEPITSSWVIINKSCQRANIYSIVIERFCESGVGAILSRSLCTSPIQDLRSVKSTLRCFFFVYIIKASIALLY